MLKMQRQQLPLFSPKLYSDLLWHWRKKKRMDWNIRFDYDHDKKFNTLGKRLFVKFGCFEADMVFHWKYQSTFDPAPIMVAMRSQQLHCGL
jgi:hypothetical protein